MRISYKSFGSLEMNSLASRRTLLRLYPAVLNNHRPPALTWNLARGHELLMSSSKANRNIFLVARASESSASLNSTAEGFSLNGKSRPSPTP